MMNLKDEFVNGGRRGFGGIRVTIVLREERLKLLDGCEALLPIVALDSIQNPLQINILPI